MRHVALLSVALVVLGGCVQAKQQPLLPTAPEVTVVTVHKEPVPVTTELPGRTSAYLVAQVRARVDGIVLRREFKEGADVKAGQRLYQIDPAPYRATLDSALAALQKAQANVAAMNAQAERYKILIGGNGVSKQEYDNAIAAQGQAAADVASSTAAVQTARINLGYTDVTVDAGTGSVTVRAVFPNPDHVLLPGMFVRARTKQGVDDTAMLVPQVGVTHNSQGQATALVVGPDNKVASRIIEATRTLGDQWVVQGGLNEGERVIVAGGREQSTGSLVRAVGGAAQTVPA